MVPAPVGNAAQNQLQQRYQTLLSNLHQAYQAGLPAGGATLNTARLSMLGATGIEGALDAVAAEGFLPRFAPPPGAQFQPIDPPF
jgi:hypothetical protein